ncbi:MAG: pilus assembly PilX N-terminal domain-containing protein [Candidatus Moranbacteria bacterium]|nr:pilus assembly PilX N-terminal domain-containing protein [Candidatus Moranbacteria bacterium]
MNKQESSMLRGSALVYGMVIMFMVSIVMTSIIGFVASQTKYSLQIHAREQAFQIAESGIHFYRWYLAHQTEGRTASQVATFWGSSPYGVGTPYDVEYTDPGGSPIGMYRLIVTPPETGSTTVTVVASGWTYRYPADIRIITVRFRRPSWSEYAVLSNDNIRFGTGTEVYGKIHSNGGIRFDGIAHNIVTSALSDYNDPDHTGNNEFGVHTHSGTTDPLPPAAVPDRPDVFMGGRSFPAVETDFNGVLGDLSYMKGQAQAGAGGSLYFSNTGQGRHIILKTNDTFDIRTVQSFNASTNEIINYSGSWVTYPIPNDGIIYVENNVWVEGTVNGRRVTIVAANLISAARKTMYLGKDIRYTNYDCSDMIGLIGQQHVEVYRQSNDVLRIDASLIAQLGRVGRANYTGPYAIRDTITVYGAIASNQRYGFSWIDMLGNHVSGYRNRNLYYDNNLLYCPPPYFPTGTQYEMDLWKE